jgi:hypothetical protein
MEEGNRFNNSHRSFLSVIIIGSDEVMPRQAHLKGLDVEGVIDRREHRERLVVRRQCALQCIGLQCSRSKLYVT